MSEKEIDEATGVETTGHEWDGIKELNNPMPRWWLWTLYASIVFAIGYMIYYPAIPLLEGSTMGISGHTNRSALKGEMKAVNVRRAQQTKQLTRMSLQDIQNDQKLTRFATAGGASLFKVYCSQCHGSGAQGAPGYPNLNDDDWLWGGDIDAIYTTIKHGVRDGLDDDARDSQMPAFGADEILSRSQMSDIAEFIMQLSGQEHDTPKATSGQALFVEQCSSCHGETGKGDREIGAPNLADAISLYGNTRAKILAQLKQPKHGTMPAWIERLNEASVKQLAIFVHSLGGGEKSKSE